MREAENVRARHRLPLKLVLLAAVVLAAPVLGHAAGSPASGTAAGADTAAGPAPAGPSASEPDAATDATAPLEEVIVTGTHIQRANVSTASPLTVVGSEEIKYQGTTS